MAEHHFLFYRPEELVFQPPTLLGGPERICEVNIQCAAGVQLRRLDSAEAHFSPAGIYRQATVMLPNYQANGITDLFGLQVQSQVSGNYPSDSYGGTVDFRLSNDGGVTWMVYDNNPLVLAWVPVPAVGPLSTYWMSESVVDAHLNTFPLTSDKQIRILMRLTPTADGDSTPRVERVTLFLTLSYDYQEDVRRSLKHHIEKQMRVKTVWYVDVVGQSTVAPEHHWENIFTPVFAYNLTTDPGRTTNLFSSIVGGGVSLTSAQTGKMEVTLFAQPPVYLAAEDFFQISTIPSVVILMPTTKERRDMRNGNGETDLCVGRGVGRVNWARIYLESDVRVAVQSSIELESLRMAEAIDRILTQGKVVLSEASGETMAVPMATPISVQNRIPVGLYVKEFAATIFGKTWLRLDDVQNVSLASEIDVLVGGVDGRSVYDTVEVL